MIKRDFLDLALILKDKEKLRLDPNISNEEKEVVNFYFYCLSRLMLDASVLVNDQYETYAVDLQQVSYALDSYVLLRMERTYYNHFYLEYRSQFVTPNEFYAVIQKVADIFNDPSLENYRAICDTTPGHAGLSVYFDK